MNSPTIVSDSLRSLSLLFGGSGQLLLNFFDSGGLSVLQSTIRQLLSANLLQSNVKMSFELFALCNELLPRLPADIDPYVEGAFRVSLFGNHVFGVRRRRFKATPYVVLFTHAMFNSCRNKSTDTRLVIRDGGYISSIAQTLLVHLIDVFVGAVNGEIRLRCLSAIAKIIYYADSDTLRDVLKVRCHH